MNKKFSAEALFVCSPGIVWSVLTDAGEYGKWYGFPEGYEIIEVDPGFEKGAIITFRNRSRTAVITEFEENRRLSIDSGDITDTISIIPREELYCTVRLETSLHGSFEAAPDSDTLLEGILEKLQSVCYAASGLVSGDTGTDLLNRSDFIEYPEPEKASGSAGSAGGSVAESTSVASRGGIIAACIMLVLLCLTVSLTADRGGYPQAASSVINVFESSGVSRAGAEKIKTGQTREQIDRRLDCMGSEQPSGEYLYSSSEKTAAGISRENILISYNSYGQAVDIVYIDNEKTDAPLETEFWDTEHELNSDMSFSAVEQIMDVGLTAFRIDRRGQKTLYFGTMDLNGGFSSKELRSEIVITLDPGERYTEVNYYPSSGDRTGLPDSPEGNLSYQYRREDVYIRDRDGFERIYTLLGRKRHEVDVVLGAGDYSQEGSGLLGKYTAEFDNEHITGYDVLFSEDGVAEKIIYSNRYLQDLQGTVKNPENYNIYRGMTSRELFAELKLIPAAAVLSEEKQVLYFGDLSENERGEFSASLVVEIDRSVNAVSDILFTQE